MEPHRKNKPLEDWTLDEWMQWEDEQKEALVKGWMDQRPEFDRPEITPEFEKVFDDAARVVEIKREVAELEAMPANTPTDRKIKKDELERLESERKKLLSKILKSSSPAKNEGGNPREGGRPPSPLRAAVEHLYEKLHDSGDHECLRSGGIQLFMKKFKEAVRKDDYIAERVERVSLSYGKWTIKTQEITAKEDSRSLEMLKSRPYDQNDVSKILSDLRNKIHIE